MTEVQRQYRALQSYLASHWETLVAGNMTGSDVEANCSLNANDTDYAQDGLDGSRESADWCRVFIATAIGEYGIDPAACR